MHNLLMSVVNTSNPLEDDNVQDVQLGREDTYGAGDSNMRGKAKASKIVYINDCFSHCLQSPFT